MHLCTHTYKVCTLDRKNLIFASSPVIAGSCSVSYFTISVTDFRLDGITKRIIIQSTRVIQKDKSSSILEVRGSWPRPSSSSSLSSLNRLSVGLAVNFETRAQSRQNYVVNKERSIAPITHSLSLSLSLEVARIYRYRRTISMIVHEISERIDIVSNLNSNLREKSA